jgi:hypothetical protein
MTRRSIARIAVPGLVLAFAMVAGVEGGPQAKGRYKKQGANCVWDANDSGPNQCTPIRKGRFKKSGDSCVWRANENGDDECRPATGRFKKEGTACVWRGTDSGPDQCNPRQARAR